jgi:hypothetical protein
MRQDARNHPGALDARHDLQPCAPTCARLDLDAEHPLEPLRPAHRHMAWPPWLLSGLHRAVCAVAPRAATRRRDQRTQPTVRCEHPVVARQVPTWGGIALDQPALLQQPTDTLGQLLHQCLQFSRGR